MFIVPPSPFARNAALSSYLMKKSGPHSYGCLMAILPKDVSEEILHWSNEYIPDRHLGKGGREDTPHITIKYGFTDSSSETVQALKELVQSNGPISVKLSTFSLFRGNEDGDVLKVGVSSLDLVKLNKIVTQSFPCEDKYPNYVPHVTVAYLDPNFASAWTHQPASFINREVLITEVEWSPPEGKKTRIPLGETKSLHSCPSCGGFVITNGKSLWCGRPPCDWSGEGKTLSSVCETTGGALVPPPKQPKPKKRSRLGGFIPQAPILGKSLFFHIKAAGQPCKQGESAKRTGCIPKSKTPTTAKQPATPAPKKKPAPAQPQPKQPTPKQQAAAAKKQAAAQAKLAAQQAKQQAAQAKQAAKVAAQQAKQTAKAAAAAAKAQAKQNAAQAKKQALVDARKFADDVVKKKNKGEALTPAELGAMPMHLAQLSVSELTKLKNALGVTEKDKTKNNRITSLILFAQNIGTKPAAPTPPPKPAPTPTPAPPTPTPSPTAGKKLSGNDPNQRDEIDDIVEIAIESVFNQSGNKADYSNIGLLLSYQDEVWDQVSDAFEPGTDKDFVLGRAMRSLFSQRTPIIVSPLYSNGTPRGNNTDVPDDLRPKLGENEKAAIQSYTGTTYRLLNGKLRQDGKPSPKLKAIDRDLDAAFRKAKPLDKPLSLTRAVTLDPAATTAFIGALQGAQASGSAWKDGGYMSTTTNASPPGKGTNNIEMRIKATHGLDAKPYSHCPQANEVILHKDSGFKVSSVKQDSFGKWVVEMEQELPSFITPAKPAIAPTPKGVLGKLFGGVIPGTSTAAVPPTPAQIAPAPKYPPASPPKPAKNFVNINDSETVKNLLSGKNLHTLHTNKVGGGREDTALSDILAESGRANTPQVKSQTDIDSLVKQGWTVMFRSVQDDWQTEQFRQGEQYTGAGIFGNGTYAAAVSDKIGGGVFWNQDEDAKTESRKYGENTMRMALPPTAKIAKISQMRQEVKQYHDDLKNQYKNKQISAIEYHRLRALTADPGRFAALKNYDAIDCEQLGYINILNRSILAVQDTNAA